MSDFARIANEGLKANFAPAQAVVADRPSFLPGKKQSNKPEVAPEDKWYVEAKSSYMMPANTIPVSLLEVSWDRTDANKIQIIDQINASADPAETCKKVLRVCEKTVGRPAHSPHKVRVTLRFPVKTADGADDSFSVGYAQYDSTQPHMAELTEALLDESTREDTLNELFKSMIVTFRSGVKQVKEVNVADAIASLLD